MTWLRRHVVLLVVLALALAATLALAAPGIGQAPLGPFAVAGFYLLGTTGVARNRPRVDLALLAAALPTVAIGPHQPAVSDVVVTWALFMGGPFAAGRLLQSRRALTNVLEANAEQAQREQEARARSAAAEERTRIARELHDVIAHSVSVMVIQTAAAREVAGPDPEAARRALTTVQASGREALLELRRMIGVLRHGDVALAGAAAPGLGQLEALAQRARQAGLPVAVSVTGPRRALPESVDLVAFRVVQEALTNTLKHAGPAQAAVRVTFGDHAVEVEVSDDGAGDAGAGTGGGHGLVGMRERLSVHGGELVTGGRPGGGFRVRARIPVAA